MEKILTIVVPAYNAEPYLAKCLGSMVGVDPRVEIIVVDDGSTDGTGSIARRFLDRHPGQVRLIQQKNGGHGSGINAAVAQAAGRYFKVVDADDWIVGESLPPLLDRLAESGADAVITGYHTVDMKSGRRRAFSSACGAAGREIGIGRLLEVYDEISACCSFHGLLYRTEPYRESGIRLSEGIFYEDQEYAVLPFSYVEQVLILPLFFYEYQVGNESQSVAFPNQVKRISHIETVIETILAYRRAAGPLRPDREEYFLRKLSVVVVSYFAVALVKNPDKQSGWRDAERFRLRLEQAEPALMSRVARKYKTLCLLHHLRVPPTLYQALLETPLYQKFRKIWTS